MATPGGGWPELRAYLRELLAWARAMRDWARDYRDWRRTVRDLERAPVFYGTVGGQGYRI